MTRRALFTFFVLAGGASIVAGAAGGADAEAAADARPAPAPRPTPIPTPLPTIGTRPPIVTPAPRPEIAGEIFVPPGSTVKKTCDHDVVHVSICADATHCRQALTAPCAPYGCDAQKTWCASSCTTTADCAWGSACATTTGKCAIMPNQCVDAFSVQTASGQIASCAPYRCKIGMCQQQCQTDADCSQGYTCRDSVACVHQ
jgi:hypothetical protein